VEEGGQFVKRHVFHDSEAMHSKTRLKVYIPVTVHRKRFLFNNQPDASIIQIYSVIKLYMFRASSLPIIRMFLLYIRHW